METIIGLDFGSHNSSLALWHVDKNSYEVFADELGSRIIPCCVAFRGEEVIVGQAALSQMHKNPSNTFDNVRDLIINAASPVIYVPVLDKEISVQELCSHYFRNVHNQVKQQVGRIVRECIVSLPPTVSEDAKSRIVESAQAGGIRIKGFITDPAAVLMAYGLDEPATPTTRAVVIDIGWSDSKVSVFNISGGLFFPMSSVYSTEISGKVLVKLLSEHCAKDFQRKAKISCLDSVKSMTRLRAQCEEIVKHLSTGQEASIDIDSFCEGIDFSCKISRARFEDMASIPLLRFKDQISAALAQAEGSSHGDIGIVCLAGGIAAVPKISMTVKSLFPSANFARARFESSECHCIGAALHGRYLLEQGMIDEGIITVPPVAVLTSGFYIKTGTGDMVLILPQGSVLPAHASITVGVAPQTPTFFSLETSISDASTHIANVVFSANETEECDLVVDVTIDGSVHVSVCGGGVELVSVDVPSILSG